MGFLFMRLKMGVFDEAAPIWWLPNKAWQANLPIGVCFPDHFAKGVLK
jgi:hypothetical protein